MNTERDKAQDINSEWGMYPVESHTLTGLLDQTIAVGKVDPARGAQLSSFYAGALRDFVLSKHEITTEEVKNVKFDITHAKTAEEDREPYDPKLQRVRGLLLKYYGTQIVSRVTLSLTEEPVGYGLFIPETAR